MKKANKYLIFTFIYTIFFLLGTVSIFAQDETKGIESEDFAVKRPAAKRNSRSSAVRSGVSGTSRRSVVGAGRITTAATNQKRKYRVVRSQPKVSEPNDGKNKMEPAIIGLTVWRSRPSVKGDQTKELIDEESADGSRKKVERTLERISSENQLVAGEKIRLGVESISQSGYLYIINRENYTDGSSGPARLIFPTMRTKDDNFVKPGNLIFIPPVPRYLIVKPSNTEGTKLRGEELIILVSPQQIINPSTLTEKALEISDRQLSDWEEKWAKKFTVLEQVGGVGQVMTLAEQKAGQEIKKDLVESFLTQDDAVPQTIYRTMTFKGNTILLNVLLRYKE